MGRTLLFRRRRRRAPRMTLGDVLFRLRQVSPKDYEAIEVLVRTRYHDLWPHAEDVLRVRSMASPR